MSEEGEEATALVEAMMNGFKTGLAAEFLDSIVVWHGNPHHPETVLGQAWDSGYGSGRACARSSPLGKITGENEPVVREERSGLP